MVDYVILDRWSLIINLEGVARGGFASCTCKTKIGFEGMALFLVRSAIESEKDTSVGREGWGGVLQISSDADDQMGGKSQNPKNSLDQILSPKKSHSEFLRLSLGVFFFGELRCRHESSDCFE